MEGDHIHINKWFLPLSWLYGAGTAFRNHLFDMDILKSRKFPIPVINVGNITVGGTGKTPHIEFLIRLLEKHMQVAVLSRGYKRKSKGYVLALPETPMEQIGDESWQVKRKFPHAHVAVDANRCRGIERLLSDDATRNTQVILLDDAFQHRYVEPGLNILLIDYHRLITEDMLLPAGRLRESASGIYRAHIVIVTKCPHGITPMGYRVIIQSLKLRPYQQLFFSTFKYGTLTQLFGEGTKRIEKLRAEEMHTLLLTGIGNPQQMEQDLRRHLQHIRTLSYPDHHYYTPQDVAHINKAFASLPRPRIIITTEKDATKLKNLTGFSIEAAQNLYVLPTCVEFLRDESTTFNENILNYVHENP